MQNDLIFEAYQNVEMGRKTISVCLENQKNVPREIVIQEFKTYGSKLAMAGINRKTFCKPMPND